MELNPTTALHSSIAVRQQSTCLYQTEQTQGRVGKTIILRVRDETARLLKDVGG